MTAKYWVREDDVRVVVMLDQLHRIAGELRRALAGEPDRYGSASSLRLPCSRPEQAESIDRVCRDVDALLPEVKESAGTKLQSGQAAVESLMRLARGDE